LNATRCYKNLFTLYAILTCLEYNVECFRLVTRINLKFHLFSSPLNPLNAELNTICHLLILLEDLTLMSPCIVSIFQYISNKMQHYIIYIWKSALHVSGGTSTHHQERIQLYLQHPVFVTPLLLSAAIVEELESVSVCCGWMEQSVSKRRHVKFRPRGITHNKTYNLYTL
jgi:hypothetical protein